MLYPWCLTADGLCELEVVSEEPFDHFITCVDTQIWMLAKHLSQTNILI